MRTHGDTDTVKKKRNYGRRSDKWNNTDEWMDQYYALNVEDDSTNWQATYSFAEANNEHSGKKNKPNISNARHA